MSSGLATDVDSSSAPAAVARAWGYATMEIAADPHAEPFYLRLGATRVGTVPSEVFPGRRLPLLRLSL